LPWYGPNVGITLCALDLRGMRIDGKHLVAGVSQLTEHGVGGLTLMPGDAGYGKASSSKKRGD
jgi:hypothetical protein